MKKKKELKKKVKRLKRTLLVAKQTLSDLVPFVPDMELVANEAKVVIERIEREVS